MLETMAYIILEVIFKMFCLLSPSAGVKFADVPTQCWPSSGCFPRWIDNSAWVDWVLYTFHRCVHSTDLQLVGRLGSYSVCPRLRSRTSLECRRLLAVGIQQACPQIAARRSSSAVAIQSLCSGILQSSTAVANVCWRHWQYPLPGNVRKLLGVCIYLCSREPYLHRDQPCLPCDALPHYGRILFRNEWLRRRLVQLRACSCEDAGYSCISQASMMCQLGSLP
jgi:hypothetical protein